MADRSSEQPTTSTANSHFATKTVAAFVALLAITLAFSSIFRSIFSSASSKTVIRTMSTTTTSTSTSVPASMKLAKRPWDDRGRSDIGWLFSYHTFSFASYYDGPQSWGPLRVINEDRVEPSTGFGAHSHAEFLIFSYVVSGVLEHKDSMGNLENLRRGEVQFTSAGTGIRHSEYNRNNKEEVHFCQIWAHPRTRGLKPHYQTRKFTDEEKTNKLCRIMEATNRSSKGAIPLDADLSMDASILSPGKSVTHKIVADGPRKMYAQVIMSARTQPKDGGAKIVIGDATLGEGDGAFIDVSGPGEIEIASVGIKPAEFLLFDMGPEEQ